MYPPVPAAGIVFLKTDKFSAICTVDFIITRSFQSRSKIGSFEKAHKNLVYLKETIFKFEKGFLKRTKTIFEMNYQVSN